MEEKLSREDYYKSLPKKRMAAAGVFLNNEDQILIVKPTYRDGWLLPGGVIEKEESPLVALHREINEELGFDAKESKFLGVTYRGSDGYKSERLLFFFFLGVLFEKDVKKMKCVDGEISEIKFVDKNEAKEKLTQNIAVFLDQVYSAVDSGDIFYIDE